MENLSPSELNAAIALMSFLGLSICVIAGAACHDTGRPQRRKRRRSRRR